MERLGDPREYYRVLGVPRTATLDEIRAAFRERAKVYHPDHGGSAADEATFKRIAEAYAVLRDPQRRAAYDLEAQRDINEQLRRKTGGGTSRGTPRSTTAGRPAMTQPAIIIILAIVAVGMAGLWWATERRVSVRDRQLVEAYDRLQAQAVRPASPLAKSLTSSAVPGHDPPFAGQPVFAETIDLGIDGPDRPARLTTALDNVASRLVGAARALEGQEGWAVLVEGNASIAPGTDSAIVEGWENAGFGLGSVVEYLAERGVPQARIVGRLQVDLLAGRDGQGQAHLVEIKLFCCSAGKRP